MIDTVRTAGLSKPSVILATIRKSQARKLEAMVKDAKYPALTGFVGNNLRLYLSNKVPQDRKPNLSLLVERDPTVRDILNEVFKPVEGAGKDRIDCEHPSRRQRRQLRKLAMIDEHIGLLVMEYKKDQGEGDIPVLEDGASGDEAIVANEEEDGDDNDDDEEAVDEERGGVPLNSAYTLPFRPSSMSH